MASITKLPSGAYRVQVRRKGRYASETFLRRDDAQKWARQAETLVDQGLPPNRSSVARLHTFGDLVDLHIADMCAVGKPPRRSKAATLATLKRDLGKEKIGHLDRHKLIEYGRKRADQGAGPVTLGIDIGVIKMILTHAAAVHGLEIRVEGVDLARVALKRLGLIGKLRRHPGVPRMNLSADMMGHQPDDALTIGGREPLPCIGQALRQTVDPDATVRVQHHLDNTRVLEKPRDRRAERGAQHARTT